MLDESNNGYCYTGSLIYASNNGNLQIESTNFAGGRINIVENTLTNTLSQDIQYHHTDHLGSVRAITNQNGETVEQNAYYPFGSRHTFGNTYAQTTNRFKFNGKEEQTTGNLNYLDSGARMYDSNIARWTTQDPLAEKYYSQSPYNYCVNNPLTIIDPNGKDTVYVFDQNARPNDRGVSGETYTAQVVMVQNGKIVGIYRGSSYPNSVSNDNNSTSHNTVSEGEYQYHNKYGHKEGTKKGLNIVDEDGNPVSMTNVNVHSGYSDNGNYSSRRSKGCITIHPNDAKEFFSHFEWSKDNPNIGTSNGKIFIMRTFKYKK